MDRLKLRSRSVKLGGLFRGQISGNCLLDIRRYLSGNSKGCFLVALDRFDPLPGHTPPLDCLQLRCGLIHLSPLLRRRVS